jgi:hypothetical protein
MPHVRVCIRVALFNKKGLRTREARGAPKGAMILNGIYKILR